MGLFYPAINYMRMKELTPYIVEKLRRTKIRKQRRKDKRKENKRYNALFRRKICDCGEDPYCYCGDGTPYSY